MQQVYNSADPAPILPVQCHTWALQELQGSWFNPRRALRAATPSLAWRPVHPKLSHSIALTWYHTDASHNSQGKGHTTMAEQQQGLAAIPAPNITRQGQQQVVFRHVLAR